MVRPLGARDVLVFGVVPACWLVGESDPPTETTQRLLARTAELMRAAPRVIT